MRSLLALAVTAAGEHDEQLAAVEPAIEQAVESVSSDSVVPASQSVTLLTDALDDEQLASGGSSTGTDREQLTEAIQRTADEELSLSADDCGRLAAAFLRAFRDELCRAAGDDSRIQQLGDRALRAGELEDAESYYRLAVDCAREVGDSSAEAAALRSLGNVALQGDDLETAERHLRESLDIAREADLRSVKADSLASLGTIEAGRGYPETAETYLAECLDLKRLLDDRLGEATCLATLGTVAESRGNYETAVDRYTAARELFSADEPRERVQTLQGLIDAKRALDDERAALQDCQQALAVLADTELPDQEAYYHWFQSTRAQLTGDHETLEELYKTALSHLRDDEMTVAFDLFEGIWAARSAAETDETLGLCFRAGVGLAAAHLLATDASVDGSRDSILAEINNHRERLSEPASALLAVVSMDGDEGNRIDTAGIDTAPTAVDDLERLAYASLLDSLTSAPPAAALYSNAVVGIGRDSRSVERVIRLSVGAWTQRGGADDPRSTVGSGLLVEAHRQLFDVDLPVDSQTVFEAAAETESLSEPMEALFEQLETGSTDWPSEPISAPPDDESISLSEAEQLAVDRILTRLTK